MNLKHIPDANLLKIMNNLAQEERSVLSKVLYHLREINNRKLYSDVKCGSLFEYCVKVLKYNEGQASRRINAIKLLKEMPELMPKIESGDLNLTQLSSVGSFFAHEEPKTKEEKLKIIDKIAGQPTRKSDDILDSMRKNEKPRRKSLVLKEETIDLIKEVHDLKAHKFKEIDEVIVEMVKLAKKEWDPAVVKRRSQVTETETRSIPKQLKAAVWERDKGQCKNCSSKRAVEYDHIVPFASGGKTTLDNLQLLCRNCNQRKGIREFPKQTESRLRLRW